MPDEPVVPVVQVADPAPVERPAWLPEKFKTPEDLAKSYKELESKLGQPKGPLDPAPPANPFADDAFTPEGVLEKVGMTEEQVYEAVQANGGKIPDELYGKFKTAGAGKGLVDNFFALRVMTRAQQTEKAKAEGLKVAGGEQQLNTLFDFGKTLPDHVKSSLNERLMNPATHASAVVELKGHYDLAHPGGGNLLEGGAGGGTDATAYKSQSDFYRGAEAAKHSTEARIKHEARCKVSAPAYTLPRS